VKKRRPEKTVIERGGMLVMLVNEAARGSELAWKMLFELGVRRDR